MIPNIIGINVTFILLCFDSRFLSFFSYPSTVQYAQMVNFLLRRWPYLAREQDSYEMPLQYGSLDWKLMSKILEKSYIHQFQKNWLIKYYMEKEKMTIVITKLLQKRESWHGVLSNSSPSIKIGKTKPQWMSTEVAWKHKIT